MRRPGSHRSPSSYKTPLQSAGCLCPVCPDDQCAVYTVYAGRAALEPGAAPEAVKVSDKRLARPASLHHHHQPHTYRWRALAGSLAGPLAGSHGWFLGGIMLRLQQGISAVAVCVCRKVSATPAVTLAASFNTHFQFQQTCWGQGGECCGFVVFLVSIAHYQGTTSYMRSLEHSCSKLSCNTFLFCVHVVHVRVPVITYSCPAECLRAS